MMIIQDLQDDPIYWNLTETELLQRALGPKHLPLYITLPMTLVYVTILITGVLGNVVTCLVIIKKPTLQTATNYYLISLAVSDFTLLVLGLPNELVQYWQQYPWVLGEVYCRFRAYVTEMSSYVSVMTIVAFSMERYLAICHPLHLYAMSGLKRPIRFIVGSWLLAIICAIPFAIYTDINYLLYPLGSETISEESAVCAMILVPNFPLYETSTVVFFIIPMAVIMILYNRMDIAIRQSNRNTIGRNVEGHVHGESRQIQSRKSVIKMLRAVVIMFFICWAPFHTQRLLYVYGRDSQFYADINEWMYTTSGCFYFFSTTVNPILYNVMSAKYRTAFREIFSCCPLKNNNRRSIETSIVRDTTTCQCESRDDGSQLIQIRSPKYPCSIRCVKEISSNKDMKNNATPRSRRILQADRSSANVPLLGNRSSNESNAKRPLEPSDSTASSTL